MSNKVLKPKNCLLYTSRCVYETDLLQQAEHITESEVDIFLKKNFQN